MSNPAHFIFLAFLISVNVIGYSQNLNSKANVIESLIESITEQNKEQLDYSSLLDDLNDLFTNPINLNTTNEQELEKLVILNKTQIKNLMKYRESTGKLFSLHELQLIPGFSYELIRKIEPFVNIVNEPEISLKRKYAKHLFLLKTEKTLEQEHGYQNEKSGYLGSSWKFYSRYQFNSRNEKLSFGITSEKDKGEPFLKDRNSFGFDFYSGYIQYKLKGVVKQVNLGDYQIKFGQGLCLWSALASGKSTFTTQNANKLQGIKAYRSTNENQFFRGASILFQPLKKSELAVFASYIKKDGTLNSEATPPYVSSIGNTGLHRTQNELNKKDKLQEKLIGSYFTVYFKNVELGVSFLQNEFSPRIWNKKKVYQYHNFSGNKNYNISFTYETTIKSIHLYGEAAQSKSGGCALLQGANIQLHPQLNFECIYRKYDPNYHAFYSSAFAEQSKTQNEEGVYFGLEFHPFPKWTLRAYYDQFCFPWLQSSTNSPGSGHEYFSQLEFTPNKSISAYLRYKQENKATNGNSEVIRKMINQQKNQYRCHLSAKLNENWEIRNRIEISLFKQNQNRESGYLLYQDLIFRFPRLPISLNCRYAIFDTDSFSSRIYAYENDVLYSYSIPSYFGKGIRLYVNLNWIVNKTCKLYLKFSQTKYSDRNTIGSGNSKIEDDTKSEIKLLLKCQF